MTISELWPLLRPLSKGLAVPAWILAIVGMGAALVVALTSTIRVSAGLNLLQLVGAMCAALSMGMLAIAAILQPPLNTEAHRWSLANELPAMVRSFWAGALIMAVGVLGFALAGWLRVDGPTTQSIAFTQVFLTGAAASGLTYILLAKATPETTE
ncbi:hypothetical protein ACQR35_01885 [Pseudarthrobacter sp. J1738]|uniref:hypothetical protein n=1 Tax=unclassified Pseudarthrobacter TaxID=2647000 RepID=UPI003D26F2CC